MAADSSVGSVAVEEGPMCDCAIERVLKSGFSSLPYEEKLNIIKSDKPKKLLNNDLGTQSKGVKAFMRHFNENMYDTVPWLCGCHRLRKLFCWPCLLFSQEKSAWSRIGFDDLNNLHKSQKRHQVTQNHIMCLKQFTQFGKTRIESCLSEQFRLSIERHNEDVRRNRRILSQMIKVVCFLGKQELAFRGHDESEGSLNRGNYVELLKEFGDFDVELSHHLSNSTVFSGLSSDIQNDIIFSVSQLMTEEIKKEISDTPFVGIIMDEATDYATKSQLSVILRYVTKAGNIEERFLYFRDVSDDRTANSLAHHVFNVLHEFNCETKLVSQTYDGAAVMSGEHSGLQRRVREKCPQAIFVHCYAHRLNLVLSQAVSFIKQCKIFFVTLSGFGIFFSKSTKRMAALDNEIKKRFPTLAPTRWTYSNRLLQTVYEHKQQIEDLLTSIVENSDSWDPETVCNARSLLSTVHDFDFNFFLNVFYSIFPQADILFQVLQKKAFDIEFCSKQVEKFSSHLTKLREDFESIWNKVAYNSDKPAT